MLNIKYICDKTLLSEEDELVQIILNLMKESYKSGLCQAEFDDTIKLLNENQDLKIKLYNKEHYINKLQIVKDKFAKNNGNMINQQKEFIKYLEDETKKEKDDLEKLCELYKIPKENNAAYKFAYSYINKMEEILQKYKEIIGYKKD